MQLMSEEQQYEQDRRGTSGGAAATPSSGQATAASVSTGAPQYVRPDPVRFSVEAAIVQQRSNLPERQRAEQARQYEDSLAASRRDQQNTNDRLIRALQLPANHPLRCKRRLGYLIWKYLTLESDLFDEFTVLDEDSPFHEASISQVLLAYELDNNVPAHQRIAHDYTTSARISALLAAPPQPGEPVDPASVAEDKHAREVLAGLRATFPAVDRARAAAAYQHIAADAGAAEQRRSQLAGEEEEDGQHGLDAEDFDLAEAAEDEPTESGNGGGVRVDVLRPVYLNPNVGFTSPPNPLSLLRRSPPPAPPSDAQKDGFVCCAHAGQPPPGLAAAARLAAAERSAAEFKSPVINWAGLGAGTQSPQPTAGPGGQAAPILPPIDPALLLASPQIGGSQGSVTSSEASAVEIVHGGAGATGSGWVRLDESQ